MMKIFLFEAGEIIIVNINNSKNMKAFVIFRPPPVNQATLIMRIRMIINGVRSCSNLSLFLA
jgi:hypothetical protein